MDSSCSAKCVSKSELDEESECIVSVVLFQVQKMRYAIRRIVVAKANYAIHRLNNSGHVNNLHVFFDSIKFLTELFDCSC